MKSLSLVGALLVALLSTPVIAGDNQVSADSLSALGLGGMKVVSDEAGMSVRGMSSNAVATSVSGFSFFVFDPISGGGIQGAGSDQSRGTVTNAGLSISSIANASTLNTFSGLNIVIATPPSAPFTAVITTFSFTGGSTGAGQ